MNTFELFGLQHFLVILISLLVAILLPWFVKNRLKLTWEYPIRLILALSTWINEISMWTYRVMDGTYTFQEHLPLHLCGFSIILSPIMLMKKNQKIYDLVYFWGLGGAIQALLTPTIEHGFPTFLFFQFFYGHGMIILSVVYATVVLGMRPTFSAMIKTSFITLGLLVRIGIVNWMIGSNYFFISGKPETPTLLDFMGPWPFYLVPLTVVGFIVFWLVYLPFPLYRKFRST